MQEHILYKCPHYMRRLQDEFMAIGYFQWFLDDNPDTFMFEDLPPPMGWGNMARTLSFSSATPSGVAYHLKTVHQ
jgi:hypothetical protein